MAFYEVETHGKEVAVRSGEVGKEDAAKQEQQTCKSEADAEKKAKELVQQKVNKVFGAGAEPHAKVEAKKDAPASPKKR